MQDARGFVYNFPLFFREIFPEAAPKGETNCKFFVIGYCYRWDNPL